MNNRNRLLIVWGLCALGLIYLVAARPDRKYSLDELHNSQVDWHGTYVGLWPFLNGKADAVYKSKDRGFIPGLILCLENNDQYAAAHVLLTQLVGGRHFVSGSAWNELEVQLIDSRQVIPATCPPAIKQRWQQWQRTQSKSWFHLFE